MTSDALMAATQRIRDLEREVERLKVAIVDMGGSLKEAKLSYVQGEADRADAGRWRYVMKKGWLNKKAPSIIDAAMAKDPQL